MTLTMSLERPRFSTSIPQTQTQGRTFETQRGLHAMNTVYKQRKIVGVNNYRVVPCAVQVGHDRHYPMNFFAFLLLWRGIGSVLPQLVPLSGSYRGFIIAKFIQDPQTQKRSNERIRKRKSRQIAEKMVQLIKVDIRAV